jgi:hypothetical protein
MVGGSVGRTGAWVYTRSRGHFRISIQEGIKEDNLLGKRQRRDCLEAPLS